MKKYRTYKVDLNSATIKWSPVDFSPCTFRYEVIFPGWSFPACTAYVQTIGTQNGKTLGIFLHLYVAPIARKQGVATLLHKKIESICDMITTCGTTKEGLSFIKKMGYKYSKQIDYYVLICKRKNK
jgi:GNAT superfamily N-acetyltransferase